MSTPQKSNKKGKWQPNASVESRRLGNAEGDWNLAGSITSLPHTKGKTSQEVAKAPSSAGICLPCAKDAAVDDDDTGISSVTADENALATSSYLHCM